MDAKSPRRELHWDLEQSSLRSKTIKRRNHINLLKREDRVLAFQGANADPSFMPGIPYGHLSSVRSDPRSQRHE